MGVVRSTNEISFESFFKLRINGVPFWFIRLLAPSIIEIRKWRICNWRVSFWPILKSRLKRIQPILAVAATCCGLAGTAPPAVFHWNPLGNQRLQQLSWCTHINSIRHSAFVKILPETACWNDAEIQTTKLYWDKGSLQSHNMHLTYAKVKLLSSTDYQQTYCFIDTFYQRPTTQSKTIRKRWWEFSFGGSCPIVS